jgi:hypothetical protein
LWARLGTEARPLNQIASIFRHGIAWISHKVSFRPSDNLKAFLLSELVQRCVSPQQRQNLRIFSSIIIVPFG